MVFALFSRNELNQSKVSAKYFSRSDDWCGAGECVSTEKLRLNCAPNSSWKPFTNLNVTHKCIESDERNRRKNGVSFGRMRYVLRVRARGSKIQQNHRINLIGSMDWISFSRLNRIKIDVKRFFGSKLVTVAGRPLNGVIVFAKGCPLTTKLKTMIDWRWTVSLQIESTLRSTVNNR